MRFLSIITINLNNQLGLERTIKSVISQTFIDFEFIIIDGGSIDDSVCIIEKYSCKITYWCSEKDTGIYNAMNKGIKLASGKYCLFLNSGDYLTSEETLYNIFKLNYSEDFLYGDITYLPEKGDQLIKTDLPEKLNISFFYNSSLWHQATLIKKELFTIYEMYNEKNKLVSDWEFFFKRIVFDNCTYRKIYICVTNYDMYNGLSVKDNELRLKEIEETKSRIIPFFVQELLDDYFRLQEELKAIKRNKLYKLYKRLIRN